MTIKIKKRKIIHISFAILLVYSVQFYIDSIISFAQFSKKWIGLIRQGDSWSDAKNKSLLGLKTIKYPHENIFVHKVTASTVAQSITAPANGATITGSAVSITADAVSPDPSGTPVTGVQFKLDGVSIGLQDTTAPYGIVWDSTGTTDGVHALSCSASTADYGPKPSAAISVTVANPPIRSNGAPSASRAAGTTQATISLTTNENATCKYSTSAGTLYSAMTSFTNTGARTTHSTVVSGLSNGVTFIYYVRCQDAALNSNTDDFPISFSVLNPGGDQVIPSTPQNFAGTAASSSQINLSWSASTDNIEVAGYRIYRNDLEIATTTNLNYSDTTVIPLTSYQYRVSAFDTSSNESLLANAITVQTPAAPVVAPDPVVVVAEKKKKKVVVQIKREIKQNYSKLKRGTTLIQSGKRFSKNALVKLYFSRLNLSYYPPMIVKTTKTGSFSINYVANKAIGKYKWYAFDVNTGKKSAVMRYEVTAGATQKQAAAKTYTKSS